MILKAVIHQTTSLLFLFNFLCNVINKSETILKEQRYYYEAHNC